MTSGKALTRSPDDRVIAGVCAGLAAWLGWPARRLRIAYVVLSVLSAAFPGMLLYLILWFLMPPGPRGQRPFRVEDPARR
jgi:phage shock protein C